MGTRVQNPLGYYSMRGLNEESSSCGWPQFYVDNSLTNGHYYNNYLPSSTADACSVYDKDVVKQMMLEHEAIFKNQVHELHRVYRKQRDLMNEFQRKELRRHQIPVDASFSVDPMESLVTTGDRQKWHISGFPMRNSICPQTFVSGVEGIHSPLGSMKGIGKQTSPFSSSNSSKDVEMLESRPSKARRRMFDLQLPADEYIDPEESEKLSDEKTSDSSFFLRDRNSENEKDGDAKRFCGNGGKTVIQEDASRFEQTYGLADLNEPAQVEETYNAPHVPLLSHNPSQEATECSDLSATAKQKSQCFGLSREQLPNSHHITDSWVRNNGYLENNGSGKWWYPSVFDSGKDKSNRQPVPQVLNLEKSPLSSHKIQDAQSRVREPASDCLNGRNKADMWRERRVSDLHRPGLFTAAPSSDLSKFWSPSASSLEMTTSSLSQKLMSIQTPPRQSPSRALNKRSQSHQSNGVLEECWAPNINSKPNPGFRCDVPIQNGFYPGSSSGSKEPSTNISSISYDHLNRYNACEIIPDHFINNGSSKSSKGSNSNCNGMNSGNGIDLTVLLSNCSSNNLVPQSDNGIIYGERKIEQCHVMLPWLRAASLPNKDQTGKGPGGKFMHNVTSVLCDNDNDIEVRRTEVNESSSNKRILGVPIFDTPHISPKKKHILDINLPCDAAVELDTEAFTETVTSKTRYPITEADCRNQIDLNLSISEDEGSFTTIPSGYAKAVTEIDLEAPVVPEPEDVIPEEKQPETSLASPQVPQEKVEQPNDDELMTVAAGTIVVLSSISCFQIDDVIDSPSERQKVDLLNWFADVASSCKDNLEGKCDDMLEEKDGKNNQHSYKGMDLFELMTLKMAETKEEDYMPQPLVPENFKVEETSTTLLPTRTRKGTTKRGRQRRDFQKDVLPSLSSLSRHEVTEDLQTFGGLMRAKGYSWNAGLTRRSSSRNGGGRGRRRAQITPSDLTPVATNETSTRPMQQLNNIEVGLEDRSLTSWGMTRRPRRQRCAASNPPLIVLT